MRALFIIAAFWLLLVVASRAQDEYTISYNLNGMVWDYVSGGGTDDIGTSYAFQGVNYNVRIPIQVHDVIGIFGTYYRVRITPLGSTMINLKAGAYGAGATLGTTQRPTSLGDVEYTFSARINSLTDQQVAAGASPYTMVGGIGRYLVELVNDSQTVVKDSVIVNFVPSDGFRMNTAGPIAYDMYGELNGVTLQSSGNGGNLIHLYANGVPGQRPAIDTENTVEVDLAGWVIENAIGEDASLWIETIDDLPIVQITGIGTGQQTDFGTFQALPGAQIRIDSVQAADGDPGPGLVTSLHTSGTQTYTVPALGGTWNSSWHFSLPDGNIDFECRVNVTNVSSAGGTLDVLYSGIVVGTVDLLGIPSGQQQKVFNFTVSVPVSLPLTFQVSSGLSYSVLNGPSTMVEGQRNVWDVAVFDDDDTFDISDQVIKSVQTDEGTLFQGATYERDLGNGQSIYWSTGTNNWTPGTKIDPTTQAGSGNVGTVQTAGGDQGFTPDEEEARTDAGADGNALQVGFDAVKDSIEGPDGIGGVGPLIDSTGAIGQSVGQPATWVIDLGTWYGEDLPTYTVDFSEKPWPQIRWLMLAALGFMGTKKLITYLKV